jgi:DNA-directed RNA polymerase subunit RPC12/RpoP
MAPTLRKDEPRGITVTGANGSNETIGVVCNHCGQAFSTFLQEMADQNAKVVCPNCRETVDCKPVQAAQAAARQQPVKKPH